MSGVQGLALRIDSPKVLADSLDVFDDPQAPLFNTLIRILATRSMLLDEYLCSCTPEKPNPATAVLLAIFELASCPPSGAARTPRLARRQLAASIGCETLHDSIPSRGALEGVCKDVSVLHRNAQGGSAYGTASARH